MASYAIHLAIAKLYLEKHPKINEAAFNKGVVTPDLLKKPESHYGMATSSPDLEKFKSTNDLQDDFSKGYYLHLKTDYLFYYNEFIAEGQFAKQIYDDYDKMNQAIVEIYQRKVYVMIYTPLIQKAMKYAYDAHHGQTDQSGVPYIFHPFYVAEKVSEVMPEEIPICVALLHDVVEDTDITLKQLEKEFPKEVIKVLALLTHNPDEDYFTYVRNLKKDPIATQVKAMDLYHNMDESRLEGVGSVTEEQREWWHRKYNKALGILIGSNQEEDGIISEIETEIEIQQPLKGVTAEDQKYDMECNYKSDRLFRPMSDSEIYQRLDILRKEILPNGKKIMTVHRFEVFAAIERMLQVLEIAAVFGLDRLEIEGKRLAESDSELERFLATGLDTGALETWSSMYGMFQIYDSSERCLWMDFIRYIYLRGVMMMTVGINSRMAKDILLSLLPEQERVLFEKYQRNKD